jgi:hypothetical protein
MRWRREVAPARLLAFASVNHGDSWPDSGLATERSSKSPYPSPATARRRSTPSSAARVGGLAALHGVCHKVLGSVAA